MLQRKQLQFNRLIILWLTLVCVTSTTNAQPATCAQFETMVKTTYTFKPSKLSEVQQTEKSNAMDRVWTYVKANKKEITPCLWSLLKATTADPFFIFDGSNLLTEIDDTNEAKQFQVDNYARAVLDDVNLRVWISTLARRGSEGTNTSKAALHWLSYPSGRYFVPEHGAYLISHEQAAMIVFGSMDEGFATPALLAVASDRNHPARETAVKLLVYQATPDSIQGLARLDHSGLSNSTSSRVRQFLSKPKLLTPRTKPKTTRAEFVSAFENLLRGKAEEFIDLVVRIPDGEHDVVAVMRNEDIPLVRRVRRFMLRSANQHSLEYYESFTQILLTMVWKPELVR